ncbi:hypothetical protein [Streptomyces sp. SID3212]|uniref:hypothetical protein n=1 Tax=Streptomyces sp. SID3212 TaxID=2690259 RepID=UPI001371C3EE|nr:hypothetical protein [Streptomyces sp. SID3212]MYV56524.1 hypothetical protein [Streptomyces sp. SID3212]
MADDINWAERAARLRASYYRYLAARSDVEAATARMSVSMRRFAEAIQRGNDQEIAQHPDLAEVNVILDAYYDPPA